MNCINCGAKLPATTGRIQAHCLTDECNQFYIEHMATTRIKRQGDCELWTGTIRKGTPYMSLTISRNKPKVERREVRVMDIRRQMIGLPAGAKRRYVNRCGNKLCVNPCHNDIEKGERKRPKGNSLNGHLDAAPLIARVERCERVMGKRIRNQLEKARERGWVTVSMGDAICCDYLHIHPTELWGEEFFTA